MSAVPGLPANYDIAISVPRNGVTPPGRTGGGRGKDQAFEWLTRLFALLVFSILGAILVSLVAGSMVSLERYGVAFLWSDEWDPVKEQFGALVPIFGTLLTSFIALAIGVPVSFGIALFLTELSPTWLKRPLGTAIELLAAIPSIIYGMWGLFVFAPLFQAYVQPHLIATLGAVPGLARLFEGPPLGIGMLTAGLILSIMVIPFIMAVTVVIGNAHRLSASLMAPGNSIASALANEFTEAVGDSYFAALIELGLILFAITTVVLAASKLLLSRLARREGTRT